jgi:O-antigen ligase
LKWVGLIAVLAAIVPLSNWLRKHPHQTPKLWMLFGFLPFSLSFIHMNMAFISWLGWPGYVKGAEFSLLDGLAIALYLGSPNPRCSVPFRLTMGFYFLATVLSATVALEPTAALFYSWQLARMFLIYVTVARGCNDPRVPLALLKGMTAGLVIELVVTIWQRFALGMVQATGTESHQNILGLMIHFVAIPAFAVVLSGKSGRLLAAAAPMGIVIDVLTASRGALGFSFFGYALLFVISSLGSWTIRKRTVLTIGFVGSLVIIPLAISSLNSRFSDKGEAQLMSSDYNERAAFEKSALMMLAENPFGAGANHYVIGANLGGYNNRAGVVAVSSSEGANVHNVYLLVAAETGYLGLITFVAILLRPLVVAMLCGWKNRTDRRGDLLIGLGVALLTVYVHGFFEWVFVQLDVQYLFAMDVGMVAGVAIQLGYWSPQSSYRFSSLQTAIPIGTRKAVANGPSR